MFFRSLPRWHSKLASKVVSITLLCGLTAATAGGAAKANGTPPSQIDGMSISDYLGSQEYWSALTEFTLRFENALGPCETPRVNVREAAVPTKTPYRVPNVGVVPQWVEILRIEGCGEPFKRNVIAFRVNGKTHFMPVLRGGSVADPFLQADVLRVLMPVARSESVKMGCPADFVVRLGGTEYLNGGQGNWIEHWSVTNCHATYPYSITFKSSLDGGTTFHIQRLN